MLKEQEIYSLSNSLFVELVQLLLKPTKSKTWLQQIVNLLKQLLSVKNVALLTYVDNLIIHSCDDPSFLNDKLIKPLKRDTVSVNGKSCKFSLIGDNYMVHLAKEGELFFSISNLLSKNEREINSLFLLLADSLKARAGLICSLNEINREQNMLKIQEILSSNREVKSQLSLIAKEIATLLNVSRCQIKFFSELENSIYDTSLSSECVLNDSLEAISVIPDVEFEWLHEIRLGERSTLNQTQNMFLKNIESLLSIQSILGFPIVCNGKPIGVLVLHQCDYERIWKDEEIEYVKKLGILLGIVLGKELELSKKHKENITDLNTGLANSDEFLRELSHLQVESQVKKTPFSLIMVDIEKLKDINLNMGFVAGNLVLSQTARYLKRLFEDSYKIARYSNDEFVVILNNVEQNKARLEVERLKSYLSNVSVLGVGTIDYNFSFVTYPLHSNSISELLLLLEQSMLLSKSRGRFQISSYDEVKGLPKSSWQQLLAHALPEIIVKKSNLKTGPDVMETISKQMTELENRKIYNADILDSVQSLALALDAKDSYTEGHSKRVSEYAYLLAKELGLDLQEIEWIRLAANMHDIGKIGIPESILCKPGKLTKEEYEVMKKHPAIGAKILKPIKPLEKVAALVLYHHEYWDGSGYPNGLSKTAIPIGARIVSIVDAYQAMTSHRPYRASLPFEEALDRLKDGREKQWDPELVDLFIKIVS